MDRCEDYPCCGHGPVSTGGDDGGCPDAEGRFDCVTCGAKLPRGHHSAICKKCLHSRDNMSEEDREWDDMRREEADLG